MDAILSCHGLSKFYGNVCALSNVSLNVGRGRIVGLLGPNGSGKSTLMKLINGLLTPSSGSLEVAGLPIGTETKKIVSYLPERTYLNDWMRVCDIIGFFKDFYADFNESKAYDMLSRLNINPHDRLKTMSKGTKEMVQLILVMSREAQLYLLDEPIGGVDPAAREVILDTILENYSPEQTILIATHLIADIERIFSTVVFIKNGQIVLNSEVEDVRQETGKSIDELFREEFRY